jgi:hypothetical protein
MHQEVVNQNGQEFSRLLYKVVDELEEFFCIEGSFTLDKRSVTFLKSWDPEGTSEVDISCVISPSFDMNLYRCQPITSWRQVISSKDEDKLWDMFTTWCSMRNFNSFRHGIVVDIKGIEKFFDVGEGDSKIPLQHLRYKLKKIEGVTDDTDQDNDF